MRMAMTALGLCVAWVAAPITAMEKTPEEWVREEDKTPALLPPALQFGAGAFLGVAGGFLGGIVGVAMENCDEDSEEDWDFCGLGGLIVGGGLGYSAGNIAGISLVGKNYYDKGYWGATALGNIAGLAAALALTTQLSNLGLGGNYLMPVFLVSVPLITTAAYHAGRQWDLRTGIGKDGLALKLSRSF